MTEDLYPLLLILSLVLVIIPSLWKLLCLFPTRNFSRVMQHSLFSVVMFAMAVAGCSLLAVDLIGYAQNSMVPGRQLGSIFGSILSVVGVSGLFAVDQWMGRRFRPSQRAWISVVLLSVLVGIASISMIRFQHRMGYSNEYAISVFPEGKVTSEPVYMAKTDRGNLIELFRFEIEDDKWKEFAEKSEDRYKNFGAAMIRREQANARSNCHGWVFASGNYLLSGSDVEIILAENNYEKVSQPKAGDVIVYRSQLGKVLHTGLVQAILNDGSPLIESKWAVDQRYIHQPKDQPFSTIYEFYRTDRPNHSIAIFERPDSLRSEKHRIVKQESDSTSIQSF